MFRGEGGIQRAWRDANEALQTGSTVATMQYDGLGRRTVKQAGDGNALTEEMGDWEATYRYYYDGWRRVEVRDGSSRTLQQTVFGLMYVDEVCQVAINQDPQNALAGTVTENLCERFFYVVQNANFNVMAVTDTNGHLIERYEYTPYGERTIYTRNWVIEDINEDGCLGGDDYQALAMSGGDPGPASLIDVDGDGGSGSGDDLEQISEAMGKPWPGMADAQAMRPVLESARGMSLSAGGDRQLLTLGLCDFGHQGLPHDREINHAVENRRRTYWPDIMRFGQIDPSGYPDGMNGFEAYVSDPVGNQDASGLQSSLIISIPGISRLSLQKDLIDAAVEEQGKMIQALVEAIKGERAKVAGREALAEACKEAKKKGDRWLVYLMKKPEKIMLKDGSVSFRYRPIDIARSEFVLTVSVKRAVDILGIVMVPVATVEAVGTFTVNAMGLMYTIDCNICKCVSVRPEKPIKLRIVAEMRAKNPPLPGAVKSFDVEYDISQAADEAVTAFERAGHAEPLE